jgi:quinol monooxygenase YgiN
VGEGGTDVAEPFIFIGTHRLQPGKLEAFRAAFADLVEVVEANEPRIIAFDGYADDSGTEVAVVQVHPDTDSMQTHMQVVRQHITE